MPDSTRISTDRRYRVVARRRGQVALLSLVDGQGREVLDTDQPLDLKCHGNGGRLRYRVLHHKQRIRIEVCVIPQNRVHRSFYPQPVASTVIAEVEQDPGEYEIELRPDIHRDAPSNTKWTGRDDTPARRLLLAGRYRLRIQGEAGGHQAEQVRLMAIAPPVAQLWGPWFPQHFTEAEADGPVSNLPDAETAAYYLKELQDGSRYDCQLIGTSRASEVMAGLKEQAGLMTYSGHGSVGRIWFYANNTDKKERLDQTTLLVTHEGCAVLSGNNREYVKQSRSLPTTGKPLRDVFLVLLNTCYAGAGEEADNMALRMITLGADFVIAFKKSIYFPVAEDFTNEFFWRCNQGQTITQAATGAIKEADKRNAWIYNRIEMKAQDFMVILKAPRTPQPHTLLPARYGAAAL